jgi:hypothetical protein
MSRNAKTDLQHALGELLMGLWNSIFGKGGSYFLEDEAAKGLGDTEYMKQTKTVRRTYPGVAGAEEFEVVKQVSAMNESTFDSRQSAGGSTSSYQSSASSSSGGSSFGGSSSSFGGSSFSAPSASSSSAAEEEALPAAPEFKPRRDVKVNTDMDMFRNLAKKVGR